MISKKIYKRVINATSEGFFTFDADFYITEINDAAAKITGYDKKELVGMRLFELCDKQSLEQTVYLASALGTSKQVSFEFVLEDKNGTLIPSFMNLSLLDSGDLSVYAFAFVVDMTGQKDSRRQIEQLKYKELYHLKQQQNAFAKQIKIIKDEISGIKISDTMFDSFYRPLDIISGDSYGTIDLQNGDYFLYIIDAMGKGLSASITSIQSSSYINNAVETAIEHRWFDFQSVIWAYLDFIKKQLLDDEIVCALFMLYSDRNGVAEIATFGMPPILLCQSGGELVRIVSNNLPISVYTNRFKTVLKELDDIQKLLCYSDGINENPTKCGTLYREFIKRDFIESQSCKQFISKLKSSVSVFEDDLTAIFIQRESHEKFFDEELVCFSSVCEVEELSGKVQSRLEELCGEAGEVSKMMFALNELLMNALEHGNFGVGSRQKQKMIEDDTYEEHLQKLGSIANHYGKKIRVRLSKSQKESVHFFCVEVADMGSGFDVAVCRKTLFKNDLESFCGRGIRVALQISDGLYFNKKGNEATFIKIVSK